MAFSLAVIVVVGILGVMILGAVLVGYSLIRLGMLRSRYLNRKREEERLTEPYKEQRKSFRNL
jgi:uncharacterized integral membrane protein